MRFLRHGASGRTGWQILLYVVAAAWIAVVTVMVGTEHGGQVANQVVGPPLLAFEAIGTAAAVRAAFLRRLDRRTRNAWRSLAVGYTLLLAAGVCFAVTPIFPGPGDVVRLCAIPFFLFGLLGMTSAPRTRPERIRAVLDIGVIVTAGFMAMWYWSLGPLVTSTGVPVHTLVVTVSYPLADLVLAFGAAAALLRGTNPTARRPLIFCILGIGNLVAADLQYANAGAKYLLTGVGGSSISASVLQWLLLLTAFGLLAGASVTQCAAVTGGHSPAREVPAVHRITLLPYVAIGGGYALLLMVAAGADLYPWGGMAGGAVAMTAIVVVRQVLVLRENQRLLVTDYLTGLATRPALGNALARSLARPPRYGKRTAVLVIDMDGFKAVNDDFGHDAGDDLLTGFARLLRDSVARADTVGRLGGDEFAIVLDAVEKPDDAVAVALRLLDAMRVPLNAAGHSIVARASIGIALSRPQDTGREIMHRADQAMYHAKRQATGWSLEMPPVLPTAVHRPDRTTART